MSLHGNRRFGVGAALAGLASLLCALGVALIGQSWSSVWLFIGAVGFGIESYAIYNPRKGDTLSETVWKLPLWGRALAAIFLIWLTIHFFFGLG